MPRLLDDSSGFWFYWMLGTGRGVVVTGIDMIGGVSKVVFETCERR
jgi:hypothetical protein